MSRIKTSKLFQYLNPKGNSNQFLNFPLKYHEVNSQLGPLVGREKENFDRLLDGELVRDFIDDCLYNRDYGYFNSHVNIFQVPGKEGIDFKNIHGIEEFQTILGGLYRKDWVKSLHRGSEEEPPSSIMDSMSERNKLSGFQQLWHTPAELYKVI